ncbi:MULTISPECIES: hypothetical protein [unclassified Tolypothrix]|uniref:hypothetical protein n=1 Tax=unclassified Tolypothrix TaxID=2649714 RepID=UPI0005EAC278|nr:MULTISPECIES: hypothetical protein [unclassified Tolypothrix]BAY92851.1 hypothetical protein NIES3275_48880 [Microchaete diplosiphon NIES-3275]EKF02935.1 hypothetical protein FDUTEX481_05738 [Tolypothrix sp. PCC 7601]MBE9086329.1 hypothetical protein [Tolypothrix sp. LEGE 11397]UYD26766.1 hypothetical protein HGR01_01200 [Tolypothrix sp. PCC 7712]UYD37377.1 hypothetical protein HG267_17615 [Tolypothrix sp. PCC 7601]
MAIKVVSKRLVIDASVARSSGGEEATYPTSVHCRDFLKAVLDICHQVVMTPDIREEWDKHQSNFARKWRIQMVARKKFKFVNIKLNSDLWKRIESIASNDKECWEMTKDLRLIEAALATDRIVISLDDKTARTLFSSASKKVEELQDIVWVNPDKIEVEKPIEWLKNGAELESDRLLGNFCIDSNLDSDSR